ncbi:hypothetical protein F4810DRAFT_709680 [Camillea tinctor]|nr:hypothetical protein F4810DRAFT_709680 [Camillea tinctor]
MTTPHVEILAALPGYGEEGNMVRVRFLCDGTSVKYGLIYMDAFHEEWYRASRVNSVILPDLPEEWTWVCICLNKETGMPFVLNYHNDPIQCEDIAAWHPMAFEYTEIAKIEQIRVDRGRKEDRMWIVQHPSADKRCLMKIAEIPELMGHTKRETEIYKDLEGADIAPQFMGHVMEQGRIVGFLVEWIEDAEEPVLEFDTDLLADALSKLHARGILHKDIHAGNFLIKDNRAYIIDFEYSDWSNKDEDFDEEIDQIYESSRFWNFTPDNDSSP